VREHAKSNSLFSNFIRISDIFLRNPRFLHVNREIGDRSGCRNTRSGIPVAVPRKQNQASLVAIFSLAVVPGPLPTAIACSASLAKTGLWPWETRGSKAENN
jgi:hypothetical protein